MKGSTFHSKPAFLIKMLGHIFKICFALALLPMVVGEMLALFDLAGAAVPSGQWRETWFISLCAGFATWLGVYILLPRTMWLYVLGHEFTHALAAMIAGGKVSQFKVASTGGHIATDRVNWWIALSPYFVPIYALIWMGLWLTVNCYYSLKAWQPILYFGIGLFWSFHLTFTFSMLHPRQTDLTREGVVFSIIIILFFNLLIVVFLLSLLTHDLQTAGEIFLRRIGQCYLFTWDTIVRGVRWVGEKWSAGQGKSGL